MTESIDSLGPVDYLVIEFPVGQSNFTGEGERELQKLIDDGIIRVLDIRVLIKQADGSIETMGMSDMGGLGTVAAAELKLADTLAAEELDEVVARMEPGSTAGVLVYENLWAAPLAAAVRHTGGQLIASGRIVAVCAPCAPHRGAGPGAPGRDLHGPLVDARRRASHVERPGHRPDLGRLPVALHHRRPRSLRRPAIRGVRARARAAFEPVPGSGGGAGRVALRHGVREA